MIKYLTNKTNLSLNELLIRVNEFHNFDMDLKGDNFKDLNFIINTEICGECYEAAAGANECDICKKWFHQYCMLYAWEHSNGGIWCCDVCILRVGNDSDDY
eukprot:265542_1